MWKILSIPLDQVNVYIFTCMYKLVCMYVYVCFSKLPIYVHLCMFSQFEPYSEKCCDFSQNYLSSALSVYTQPALYLISDCELCYYYHSYPPILSHPIIEGQPVKSSVRVELLSNFPILEMEVRRKCLL